MYQKVDYQTKTCKRCGSLFNPKTKRSEYCTKVCRNGYADTGKTKEQLRAEAIKRRTFTCRGCGNKYIGKDITRNKYCSRGCGLKAGKVWKCDLPAYSTVYTKQCKCCGIVFVTRWKRNHVCSNECAKKRAKKRNNARTLSYDVIKQRDRATVSCIQCGIRFSRLYRNKALTCSNECSNECRDEARRVRAKAYGHNHRSRARHYGVEYEPVDVLKVMSRDNWICQLCGCSAPQALRGSLNDSAPELDHVIPLSKGGSHTYDNVQCSCRLCNILKGNMMNEEYIQQNQTVAGARQIAN